MSKQIAKIRPHVFGWYPSLSEEWSGDLVLVGAYLAGDPLEEVIVRNASGSEMAMQRRDLVAAGAGGSDRD